MGRNIRKLVFTTHVASSLGWFGAVLVFLTLAVIGVASPHEPTARGAYLLMAPTAWLTLVPLAHASLLSGVAISLGTPWGLFRHYWVVSKLAITLVATIVLVVYMGTFNEMAAAAGNPMVELWRVRNPSPVAHSALALIALIIATVLGMYKPFGVTPYGRDKRELHQEPARASFRQQPQGRAFQATASLVWAGSIAVAVVILFIVLHFFLGGQHGH